MLFTYIIYHCRILRRRKCDDRPKIYDVGEVVESRTNGSGTLLASVCLWGEALTNSRAHLCFQREQFSGRLKLKNSTANIFEQTVDLDQK